MEITGNGNGGWFAFSGISDEYLEWVDAARTVMFDSVAYIVVSNQVPYHAAPVPEPATLSLFGLGLVGFGITRLRKKKRNSIENFVTTQVIYPLRGTF